MTFEEWFKLNEPNLPCGDWNLEFICKLVWEAATKLERERCISITINTIDCSDGKESNKALLEHVAKRIEKY